MSRSYADDCHSLGLLQRRLLSLQRLCFLGVVACFAQFFHQNFLHFEAYRLNVVPVFRRLQPFDAAQLAGPKLYIQRRGVSLAAGSNPLGNRELEGRVKSFNTDKGFGFIECQPVFEFFKRDVFLHKQQAEGLAVGDQVKFMVEMNDKGNPQARNVKRTSKFQKKGLESTLTTTISIEDVWAQAEEELQTEEPADPWAEATSASNDAWALAEASEELDLEDVWAQAEKFEQENEESPIEEEEEEQVVSTNTAATQETETGSAEVDDAEEVDRIARLTGLHPAYVRGNIQASRQKEALEAKLVEISAADSDFAEKSSALARLTAIVSKYDELLDVSNQVQEAKEVAATSSQELAEMAAEEVRELRLRRDAITQELQQAMLPSDPRDDTKAVMVEIRPGVGGGEAGLWAEDLVTMYTKYCLLEGLDCKAISLDKKEGGGLVEATLRVTGDKVWSKLKYESGVHRVQRVPATERAGRVHTSTATVAIMPEYEAVQALEESEVVKDIEFTYMKCGGKGGQNVNKLETGCRALHRPTGIVVDIREERSQMLNRNLAIRYIIAKIKAQELEALQKESSELRQSQIGSGGRSEKIRSYQFKENRVSDHRLNQNFPLSAMLEGNLQEPVRMMALVEQEEKLAELERSLLAANK